MLNLEGQSASNPPRSVIGPARRNAPCGSVEDVQLKDRRWLFVSLKIADEIWHTVVLHYWVEGYEGGVYWSQWSSVQQSPYIQASLCDRARGVFPVKIK